MGADIFLLVDEVGERGGGKERKEGRKEGRESVIMLRIFEQLLFIVGG